ncbi:MAG: DNA starvation/stationary phase protection protein [Alphaproteobacteria bacterium]|nr:DNA starvation/stationary phase protection protein [Alphaproteobacteria bacterium]
MSNNTLKVVDDVKVHIGVNPKARAKVAKHLSGFLASTYTLYMKTLFYHWNVTGPHFPGLHKLFEDQYQELHMAGDELAERVRALGHMTPGTYREFTQLSKIKEDEELPKDSHTMLENLMKSHEACSLEAREVLNVAEDCGDEVTVDMMVERMSFHDKTAWMLRATIE